MILGGASGYKTGMRPFLTFLAVTVVGTIALGLTLEATIGRERSDDYSNFRVAAIASALAGVAVARSMSRRRTP